MKPLDLTPRLAAVAAQVPPGARLADVGTDHAYLPVWLLLAGRIVGAVATDVNQGPLQRGQETAQRYGVAHRMDFRRCDGLAALSPGEVDTVVIAGMGGDLMVHILSAAPAVAHGARVCHPLGGNRPGGGEVLPPLYRHWGQSPRYSPGELWAGRQQQGEDNPHRLAYLTEQIRRRQRALEGMAQSSHPDPAQLDRERTLQNDLQRMREEWTQWQR